MTCQLRGDEAELFRRYGDWLLCVTRLRLQCPEALAEDGAPTPGSSSAAPSPSLPGWLRSRRISSPNSGIMTARLHSSAACLRVEHTALFWNDGTEDVGSIQCCRLALVRRDDVRARRTGHACQHTIVLRRAFCAVRGPARGRASPTTSSPVR